MSMDRLSNMISTLKNHAMAGRVSLEIPFTKECEAVAKVLEKHGYLADVRIFKPEDHTYRMLHIDIATDEEGLKVTNAVRISKPGRRIYAKSGTLGIVKGGYGVRVVSTSRGIMDSMEARKKKLGGEVLCEVM